MPSPKTRNEMKHNFYLVLEDFIGKIEPGNEDLKQNIIWAIGRHLKEIKITSNCRINVATINEIMRLHSNMMKY